MLWKKTVGQTVGYPHQTIYTNIYEFIKIFFCGSSPACALHYGLSWVTDMLLKFWTPAQVSSSPVLSNIIETIIGE